MAKQITLHADGAVAVSGPLTLASVPGLWRELETHGLMTGARAANLAAVTEADSAGLAMLVTWRGKCLAAGNKLEFQSLPERILALARLTGAEAALG